MAKPLLLLVEDDVVLGRMLAWLLGSRGWEVRHFGDAEDALAFAQDAPVAAVLTDYDLPGRSGLAMAAALRRWGFSGRIVMMSGGARGLDLGLAAGMGIAAVLEKPFGAEEVCWALGAPSLEKPAGGLERPAQASVG